MILTVFRMENELRDSIREEIVECYNTKNSEKLKELFELHQNIDIAEAMESLDDVAIFLYVFRTVNDEYSADVFSDLSAEKQEMIINSFGDKQLIELLNNSFTDDIVDSLEDLPANVSSRILRVAPKELRNDINRLLNYKANTAGSIMTTEYVELKDTLTVKEAINFIREKGRDAETIYTIFVKDNRRNMVGTIDLDDLIFAKEEDPISEVMNRDFVTCKVSDDQEEVANMFKRYDLQAMAVLNNENKLCGIITIDDAVDILVEEATEDIAHLGQVSNMDDPYLKTPILSLVKKCVPWIIILMILQVFSSMIISGFESEIAKFAILSVFTPLIMDAGGNSGGQTTTIIVRALALDEFKKGDMKKVVWKEFRVALIIAAMVSIFAFAWLMFEMSVGIVKCTASSNSGSAILNTDNDWVVRLVVSALVAGTLFVTILVARMLGSMLPFLAKKLKRDPAVMCSPLITTTVDVISLLTYFLLWSYVFGPMILG